MTWKGLSKWTRENNRYQLWSGSPNRSAALSHVEHI